MGGEALVSEETDRAEAGKPPCPEGGHPALPTVMIVEDDEDLADLLQFRLRQEGFATVMAADGTEACRLLTEVEIELVLLDILMPGLDGWGVCRRLRSHPDPRLSSLPVIMLTALATGENRIKGLECGADVYLAKPYSIREVVLNAKRLIAERRQRLQLQAEVNALREKEQGARETQRMLFHELRSQFTVIGGLCQRLLQKEDPVQLSKLAKEGGYLEVIRTSVNQVADLADEVLILSRLAAGDLTLPRSACLLDEIVSEVMVLAKAKARMKGVDLLISPLPREPVALHPLALKIILASLVENAVKYSPAGGAVSLQVAVAAGVCALEVRDQGPGIPVSEQERIFTPFFRGEGVRDSHPGSGLGLYSVKRLTKALGGAVEVISTPGAGALFRVVFEGC